MATRISLAIVAGMFALSAWAWGLIPPGAEIPIHWNAGGQVDGTAGRTFGLLVTPVIGLLITGLLGLVPKMEPRREHLERSSFAYVTVIISVIALMAFIHVLVVVSALGTPVAMERLMPAAIGVLFIVLGSVMHRMESTYMMGIRTPWTLASERSWEATHRAGRWVFVAIGIGLLAIAGIGDGEAAFAWMIGGLVVGLFGLMAYSYVVWRGDAESAEPFGR